MDQSRLEATELKRRLAEKTNDGKLWGSSSKDAVRRASSSGSLEKMGGLQHTSMSSSPWSTYDGNTLNVTISAFEIFVSVDSCSPIYIVKLHVYFCKNTQSEEKSQTVFRQ